MKSVLLGKIPNHKKKCFNATCTNLDLINSGLEGTKSTQDGTLVAKHRITHRVNNHECELFLGANCRAPISNSF